METTHTYGESKLHWTRWDWQPAQTTVSDIEEAEFLGVRDYRLDVFKFRNLWHWSAVCPVGHSMAGVSASKEDARDDATKAAADHDASQHA
jgi:hypothetical protein